MCIIHRWTCQHNIRCNLCHIIFLINISYTEIFDCADSLIRLYIQYVISIDRFDFQFLYRSLCLIGNLRKQIIYIIVIGIRSRIGMNGIFNPCTELSLVIRPVCRFSLFLRLFVILIRQYRCPCLSCCVRYIILKSCFYLI